MGVFTSAHQGPIPNAVNWVCKAMASMIFFNLPQVSALQPVSWPVISNCCFLGILRPPLQKLTKSGCKRDLQQQLHTGYSLTGAIKLSTLAYQLASLSREQFTLCHGLICCIRGQSRQLSMADKVENTATGKPLRAACCH